MVSHPSWVCGLKLKIIEFIERRTQVTPFVGVWIETRQKNSVLKAVARHTLRGCVDWNTGVLPTSQFGSESHTLRGCVDWNNWAITSMLRYHRHTLRGCVDWNTKMIVIYIFLMSHTLRGCVDWNQPMNWENTVAFCHTLRGCVDWNGLYKNQRDQYDASHPSWVCGMKQKTDFIFWAHLKKSFLRKRAIDCQ